MGRCRCIGYVAKPTANSFAVIHRIRIQLFVPQKKVIVKIPFKFAFFNF